MYSIVYRYEYSFVWSVSLVVDHVVSVVKHCAVEDDIVYNKTRRIFTEHLIVSCVLISTSVSYFDKLFSNILLTSLDILLSIFVNI